VEIQQLITMERKPNLTVFTGTKAMFIKLVPLVLEFKQRGWPYRIIDTGQHAELVSHIIEQFGLSKPDISLDPGQEGVSTLTGGMRWMLRLFLYLLRGRNRLKEILFKGQEGIAFIHGDTMSTLLSCLIAKRAGQKVVHVEAGLRSFNYLHPFPEEICRVLTMRMADHLFAPSKGAFENLQRMGLSGKSHLLSGNTNLDTMALTMKTPHGQIPELPDGYSLATIHRVETIYSRKRLQAVVDTLLEAHMRAPVIFIQHPPTVKRLRKYGFDRKLEDAGITGLPLLDHARFLRVLKEAKFVITDGGSIQEEASYLGTPCLLLRKTTERDEGLCENVILSRMDREIILDFLDNFEDYRTEDRSQSEVSPSTEIADIINGFR